MSQPQRLGKYQVTDVLGKGAMGVVYKAHDPDIERTVAIKTIRRELVEDDDRAGMVMARFKNEARAAGRLSHPGIVSVYDYGEAEDVAFIAMEFVEGNSLRAYFSRETQFEERDVVSLMAQLLDALQHAHEQGVWHRDVKPANIIIMNSGKLKVADFGIARIDSSSLTQVGAVMGSPGYMAPEQYKGNAVDWRADIFAAAVMLYQLLTGARPFTGSTEQLAYKVCYESPPPPSVVAPGRELERYDPVVARGLGKAPEERYASAAEFKAAILEAYAEPVEPHDLGVAAALRRQLAKDLRVDALRRPGVRRVHGDAVEEHLATAQALLQVDDGRIARRVRTVRDEDDGRPRMTTIGEEGKRRADGVVDGGTTGRLHFGKRRQQRFSVGGPVRQHARGVIEDEQ
ncbi:MAG: serine/threonine protein kinase [Gammaproteobacteria bacterium]|nr:serine/threonine protein kinase [Gammaproteobacteria bacterium]